MKDIKKHKPDDSEAKNSTSLKKNVAKKKNEVLEADVTIMNGKVKKKHKMKTKDTGLGTCGSWDISSAKFDKPLKKKANFLENENSEELQKKQKIIALSILTESLKNSKMPTLRPVLTKLEDQNGVTNLYIQYFNI